jgi:large subunit ribosomal protein L25|tara:strand:+ start:342 stop:1004 length:663 start_codon:yes stop_codon:yes gene_type:complete
MSDNIQLSAELRTDIGKGASRRLRRLEDKVPGIIYGEDKDPQMLTLSANEMGKAMQQEAFYSQIIDLSIDGKKEQAVVRDLQRNPANERLLHIDFLRISANKTINVSVPLHFLNEEACIGVKIEGGTLTHNMTEVEITCLPAALPEYIEVDMAEVAAGVSIHLSELIIPEGVAIAALAFGEDRDIPVASVTARRGTGEDEEISDGPAVPPASADDEGGEG